MHVRSLGRSGLLITPVGLGCVTFGREIDQDASFEIMDHAVEKGVNWLDTAEAYGGGNARAYRRNALGVDDVREVSGELSSSERIIGRWIKARGGRDRLILCTKVSSGNTPDNIHHALQNSLERLQVDRVDLYKLHSPNPQIPVEESLDALTAEVNAGRVRAIGCSNFSLEQLEEAIAASEKRGYARFEAVQPPYSLATPDIREDILPYCRQKQIGVTTFSPLAAGFLSGKYSPDRTAFPAGSRFHVIPAHADIYFSETNFTVVERLRKRAAELGVPMVRLAMAWVLTDPDVTSVIVGARNTGHMDNAFDALDMNLSLDLRDEMTGWTRV